MSRMSLFAITTLLLLLAPLILGACGRERLLSSEDTMPTPLQAETVAHGIDDSADSEWGKMDEGLYNALQLARADTLLPITISSSDPWGYRSMEQVNEEMRAKYGELYDKWRGGVPISSTQHKALEKAWQERFAELDLAASVPMRAGLDALGIDYTWRERERSVDAWLTQQQVAEVAKLDAVADMRYVGYPDPNYIAPTPTVLPQGWEYVPFESVAFTFSGHSVEGQVAGAQIVGNIDDVPTNIFDPNATPNPVTGDNPTYFYIYAWRSGVSSSCYSIEIKRTVLAGSTLKVFVDMWEPTEGMACTADSTTVQHIVSIDRTAVGVDPRLLNLEFAPTTRLGTYSWGRP